MVYRFLSSIFCLLLIYSCNPELRQLGERPKLSLSSPENVFYHKDLNAITIALHQPIEKQPESYWLLAELSTGGIYGLPFDKIKLDSQNKSFELNQLFNDSCLWYKLGHYRIHSMPNYPNKRKQSTLSFKDVRHVKLTMHHTLQKNWTPDKPLTIHIAETRWNTNHYSGIKVGAALVQTNNGIEFQCKVSNESIDGLHVFMDAGTPRFVIYGYGIGKAGIHQLTFLAPFWEKQSKIEIATNSEIIIFKALVKDLLSESTLWEWYMGPKRTRPDQVGNLRTVSKVSLWFVVVSTGKTYYSKEVFVPLDFL
jgi:hypothetical protein